MGSHRRQGLILEFDEQVRALVNTFPLMFYLYFLMSLIMSSTFSCMDLWCNNGRHMIWSQWPDWYIFETSIWFFILMHMYKEITHGKKLQCLWLLMLSKLGLKLHLIIVFEHLISTGQGFGWEEPTWLAISTRSSRKTCKINWFKVYQIFFYMHAFMHNDYKYAYIL